MFKKLKFYTSARRTGYNATNIGELTSAFAKGTRRTGYNTTNIGGFTFGFTLAESTPYGGMLPAFAKGFTLAEVLITLGIIGIVAAMTMPTLMANIAKRKALSKLTKAYAEINLAYKTSLNDLSEPTPEEARTMGGKKYYETYWAPYIRASHYCTSYKDCGYASSTPWITRNGSYWSTYLSTNSNMGVTFYTASGVVYMIRVTGGNPDENGVTPNSSVILIDINGGQLPNQLGKDVFEFNRNSETGTIDPICKNDHDPYINTNCSSNGACCAEKIRRAGWKMDSTYPW